jgi:hypothetical protein
VVDRRRRRQEEGAPELHLDLLSQIPYDYIHHQEIPLPPRVHNPDYHRGPVPKQMYVPAIY